MYKIYNIDNSEYSTLEKFDIVYCDCIYEVYQPSWVWQVWDLVKPNGIFMIQTDWHTVSYYDNFCRELLPDCNFLNNLVWKNEWGNHSKDRFHQCFDNVLLYYKGKDHKFFSEKIQVDKVTKNKGLNPSGRETKTATAWIDDICLTTTSKERVKKADGHLIRWQKPVKLFERIVGPFTQPGDSVLDFFMGSGSLGEYCIKNDLEYVGIELDTEVFELGKARLERVQNESK